MTTNLKRSLLAAGALLGFLGTDNARAALTLNLDTGSKEFWFTGTDSGTPLPAFSVIPAQVGWLQGDGGSSESYTTIDLTQITATGNTLFTAGPAISYLGAFETPGRVYLQIVFDTNASVTLTGTGPAGKLSYSGWGASQQSNLESYIGGSLGVVSGTGFSNVQVAAVPEPTISLLAGLGGIAFVMQRRRRNA